MYGGFEVERHKWIRSMKNIYAWFPCGQHIQCLSNRGNLLCVCNLYYLSVQKNIIICYYEIEACFVVECVYAYWYTGNVSKWNIIQRRRNETKKKKKSK